MNIILTTKPDYVILQKNSSNIPVMIWNKSKMPDTNP